MDSIFIAQLITTLSTNWVSDPLSANQELGLVYSNTVAQVIYRGKTNELTLESTPIAFAPNRTKPTIINGNPIFWPSSTNIYWNYTSTNLLIGQ